MRFTHAYRDTFRPEEVLVALTQSTQNPLYDGLGDKIRQMAGACGFTFLERGASDLLTLPRTFKIKHSIILDEGDQIRWILGKHLAHLDHFDSISLGTVYSSQEAMAGARETIDLLKGKFGDRVNFLRPDEACPATGEHYVSHQKIVDNGVCDGEPLLGHRIATVIGDHLNNFIILEDHGEFFNFSMAGDLTRPAAQVEAFAAESLRVAESLLSTP